MTVNPENMDMDQLFAWFGDRVKALRQHLVVVGDFGEDLDDEDTLLFQDGERRKRELCFLNTHGSLRQDLFELKAVVANLAPPLHRARLAKGTLQQIGQPHVPVGVGTDCGNAVGEKLKKLQNIPYLADASEVEEGAPLILRTLQKADDHSLTFILISGLTDIAAILREHADLFRQKVRSVAIMGGVTLVSGTNDVFINAEGFFEPDSAANNAFDMESAKFVYRRFQELAVPMVILTRFAAGACQVPRSFYDDLAATGHPVGVKLRRSQQASIESLWKRANMPADEDINFGTDALRKSHIDLQGAYDQSVEVLKLTDNAVETGAVEIGGNKVSVTSTPEGGTYLKNKDAVIGRRQPDGSYQLALKDGSSLHFKLSEDKDGKYSVDSLEKTKDGKFQQKIVDGVLYNYCDEGNRTSVDAVGDFEVPLSQEKLESIMKELGDSGTAAIRVPGEDGKPQRILIQAHDKLTISFTNVDAKLAQIFYDGQELFLDENEQLCRVCLDDEGFLFAVTLKIDDKDPCAVEKATELKDLARRLVRRATQSREKLPARCDKAWFCNTFLAGKGQDRNGEDSIWDLVVSFNLYDPMTMVAAVPALRKQFFDPTVVKVCETEHLVIGVSKGKHSVVDSKGLSEYMTNRCLESLQCSFKEVHHRAARRFGRIDT